MVPGVRTLISLPAGFTAMPLPRFLAYSTLGTLAWTGLLATAGMILQANFGLVGKYIDVISNAVLVIFVSVLAIRYVKCFRRNPAISS
jgi:membrane protein DedA with SNARE-associated domain